MRSADLLVKTDFRVASAHFGYYSLFLLLKHLLDKLGLSYQEQDKWKNEADSHQRIKNEALSRIGLSSLRDKNDYFVFYNAVEMMRKKADYKPVPISESQLKINIENAHQFHDGIVKHFNLQ